MMVMLFVPVGLFVHNTCVYCLSSVPAPADRPMSTNAAAVCRGAELRRRCWLNLRCVSCLYCDVKLLQFVLSNFRLCDFGWFWRQNCRIICRWIWPPRSLSSTLDSRRTWTWWSTLGHSLTPHWRPGTTASWRGTTRGRVWGRSGTWSNIVGRSSPWRSPSTPWCPVTASARWQTDHDQLTARNVFKVCEKYCQSCWSSLL